MSQTLNGQATAARVQQMLSADQNLAGYALKARWQNGLLCITGIVDTAADKDYLRTQLYRMGISVFADEISISTDGQVLDSHVVTEVRQEIAAHPNLTDVNISIDCSRGTVFLSGQVHSRSQEEQAIAAARKARGVTRVVSHLHYIPGQLDHQDWKALFHSQVNNDGPRWERD